MGDLCVGGLSNVRRFAMEVSQMYAEKERIHRHDVEETLRLPHKRAGGQPAYAEWMKLTVDGVEQATGKYQHLWGYYVRGFKPWEHCQDCFIGSLAKGIERDMKDGTVMLDKPMDYFYLCGVAMGSRKELGEKNLHLAVRPKAGSQATIKSVYGPVFTIDDAEMIEIQPALPITDQLPKEYANCKNFRFAAQMYPADVLGPDAKPRPVAG